MLFYFLFYFGKQIPSDLMKLPCCAVKACLLSKIFSVLEIIWSNSISINIETTEWEGYLTLFSIVYRLNTVMQYIFVVIFEC